MHRTMLMVIVAGLLVAGGLMSVTAQAQQRSGARPVAVAVVDVESVFENMDEQAAVKADLTSQISNLQKWEQGQQKAIKAKQGELDVLPQDSKEYQQAQDDLTQMAIGLKVQMQFRQQQIERAKAVQTENLYRKILAMIERVAKSERYDLVLFKDNTPNMGGANQQQVAALIQVRKLLYSAPDLDITGQITQKLNNEYNNTAGNG